MQWLIEHSIVNKAISGLAEKGTICQQLPHAT
jgi:hypothetical protein